MPNGKPDFSGIWQSNSPADYDLEPHAARRDALEPYGVRHALPRGEAGTNAGGDSPLRWPHDQGAAPGDGEGR